MLNRRLQSHSSWTNGSCVPSLCYETMKSVGFPVGCIPLGASKTTLPLAISVLVPCSPMNMGVEFQNLAHNVAEIVANVTNRDPENDRIMK